MEAIVPRVILEFDAVESTNDTAKELLGDRAEEGTVVVARRQVAGRGRHGRAWFSPLGGLYCSIVLKPEEREVQLLSLLSGLPVAKALRRRSIPATLKWPNDVVAKGRKVGGILCEGVYRGDAYWVVVGIGVNTNVPLDRLPAEVRGAATSVLAETGAEVPNEEVLEHLLREYDAMYRAYASGAREDLVREYVAVCSTLQRRVEVAGPDGRSVRGTAVDVTPLGALVVARDDGKRVEVADGTVTPA